MTKLISAPRHGFILNAATEDQKDTVMDYMKSINGRSKANVITYFVEIEKIAELAEKQLDHAHVSKKERIGCTAYWRDGGPNAKSYDYAMTVNEVSLQRYAEGWRLMQARKVEVRHRDNTAFNVCIPARYIEALKAEAVRKATAGLSPLSTRKAKPEGRAPVAQALTDVVPENVRGE